MNNSTGALGSQALTPLAELVLWCIAYITIDACILIGNILTLIVFHLNKRLLRTRANYFLVNLAVADLLVGLIAVPMFTYYLGISGEYGGVVWNRYPFKISKVLDIFFGCASVFTITIIAIERVCSVCIPHIHRGVGSTAYFVVIVLVWMASAFVSLLNLLTVHKMIPFNAFFYTLLVLLCGSILIISVSYPVIGVRMKFRFANVDHHRKTNDQDRRLVLMLFLVTSLFILTWLPFHVLNTVTFFCMSCRFIPYEVPYFIKLLHYGNSLINPVIYSYLVPEFKKTISQLFKQKNASQCSQALYVSTY
ncbi:adenosine receptor A3 isoform X2 [Nematostella vectensis]|nr:adenosine receptor A3 isoform X2 [Nematostella vectensis]XP_032219340.2 adenosine receptor A3 isoform X2 [Nematostella vectensis]